MPISATATITIPALTERTAETTVDLGSGQSFMLGGLLQDNSTQSISKVPALGDLPILGQLFRSEQFQRNESESRHHRHAVPRQADADQPGDADRRLRPAA